jgi:hypothetical protein
VTSFFRVIFAPLNTYLPIHICMYEYILLVFGWYWLGAFLVSIQITYIHHQTELNTRCLQRVIWRSETMNILD